MTLITLRPVKGYRYAKEWTPLEDELCAETIKLHNAMIDHGYHIHMTQHGLDVDGIKLTLMVSQYSQEHRVWNRNQIHGNGWTIRWRHANETVIDSFEFMGMEEQMLADITYLKMAGYL